MSGRLLLRCEKSFKSTIHVACRTVILHAEIVMYIYVKNCIHVIYVDLRARTPERVANRHVARILAFKLEK